MVEDWARRMGAELSSTYTPSVAHVIVQKDDENCAQRTLKFFFDGKWTFVIDWVHQYINDNKFVNEKPFEVLDFDGEIVFVNPEKMGQITSCLEHTNFVVKLISPIWLISLEVQRKAVSLFETIQVVSVSRGWVLDCISGLALGFKVWILVVFFFSTIRTMAVNNLHTRPQYAFRTTYWQWTAV